MGSTGATGCTATGIASIETGSYDSALTGARIENANKRLVNKVGELERATKRQRADKGNQDPTLTPPSRMHSWHAPCAGPERDARH